MYCSGFSTREAVQHHDEVQLIHGFGFTTQLLMWSFRQTHIGQLYRVNNGLATVFGSVHGNTVALSIRSVLTCWKIARNYLPAHGNELIQDELTIVGFVAVAQSGRLSLESLSALHGLLSDSELHDLCSALCELATTLAALGYSVGTGGDRACCDRAKLEPTTLFELKSAERCIVKSAREWQSCAAQVQNNQGLNDQGRSVQMRTYEKSTSCTLTQVASSANRVTVVHSTLREAIHQLLHIIGIHNTEILCCSAAAGDPLVEDEVRLLSALSLHQHGHLSDAIAIMQIWIQGYALLRALAVVARLCRWMCRSGLLLPLRRNCPIAPRVKATQTIPAFSCTYSSADGHA